MSGILAGLFTLVLILCLALNIFSLPGNWLILGLALVWKWINPEMAMGWWLFGLVLLLLLVGEILEWFGQIWGGKRYGASRSGNIAAIVGAVAGAIVFAPFLFGLGALLGAFAGAYAGSFVMEKLNGRSLQEAGRAALGAFWGKVFGVVAKIGLGAISLFIIVPRLWS
jgi:hypothetical protein